MAGAGVFNEPKSSQPKLATVVSAGTLAEAKERQDLRRTVEQQWATSYEVQGWAVFRSQGQPVESPYRPERLTGPVRFLKALIDSWELNLHDASRLLGYEDADRGAAEALLEGRTSVRGVDLKTRIATLFRIKAIAGELFRDGELQWMRTPRRDFGNVSPIDYLRGGSMERLLTLRQYLEHAAGL